MKLRSSEAPDEAVLLVLHDVVVSTFKFGGNRRFFGTHTAVRGHPRTQAIRGWPGSARMAPNTANFAGCRGDTHAIPLLFISHIPVA